MAAENPSIIFSFILKLIWNHVIYIIILHLIIAKGLNIYIFHKLNSKSGVKIQHK